MRIADHWPSHNLDLAEMDNVMLVDSVENDRLSYSRIDVRDLDDVSLGNFCRTCFFSFNCLLSNGIS